MSKNVFVEAGSFRHLLLGAAGGYELQGYHEAAQTVMHVIDALDELTTGGKGRSQEDEDWEAAEAADAHADNIHTKAQLANFAYKAWLIEHTEEAEKAKKTEELLTELISYGVMKGVIRNDE